MTVQNFDISVGGSVSHKVDNDPGLLWADLVAGAGTDAFPGVTASGEQIVSSTLTGKWRQLDRTIYMFNTASIPDGATIQSAILRIRGSSKGASGYLAPTINVYSANPASEGTLVAADFATVGSTPFCDTPLAYADMVLTGDNDFALNDDGLAAISKTGITKLGLRTANYEVPVTPPTWAASSCFMWFNCNTAPLPRLIVTYSVGRSFGVIID